MNCPYCGSDKFARISCDSENQNIKYILTQVDVETNSFNPTSGLPVDAYGCPDCKAVVLKCPNI